MLVAMKSSILLLFSTIADCSDPWRRQNRGASLPPLIKPVGIAKSLNPATRSDATRKLVRYGPFSLPGVGTQPQQSSYRMDPNGHSYLANVNAEGLCGGSCTVLVGQATMEYGNGSKAFIANGVYNHHIMGYINDRKVPQFISSCETKSQPSSATHSRAVRSTNDWSDIFGAMFLNFGNDQNAPLYFSTLDSKFPSGVQLESNNTISLQIELVNYNTESREVYIVLDVEYLPGIQRKDVQSVLVNVSCWKPMPVDKTKEYRLKSQELVIQEDGTLLNARGHLHDGGTGMVLYINDKAVCNSEPTYGGELGTFNLNGTRWETISQMSLCTLVMPVKRGDRVVVESVYNLNSHPLRKGHDGMESDEMGLFDLKFVPIITKSTSTEQISKREITWIA